MTRSELRALYLRVLPIATLLMLLYVFGANAVSDLRAWSGTSYQWSSELAAVAMICAISVRLAVLIVQRYRPSSPHFGFTWNQTLWRIALAMNGVFLAVFGGWLGRVVAVAGTALLAFLWLRSRH